jgi:hypothetical protein
MPAKLMKANTMNHAFSPFLAENQRPMNFQKDAQMPRGINTTINNERFGGKISRGAPYNAPTPRKESETYPDF